MRILLVDAVPERRARIGALLDGARPAHHVGVESAYETALAPLSSGDYDVVVMDLGLVPRSDDGAFARDVFRRIPVPVLVVTTADDVDGDHEAMYAGAAGCLVPESLTPALLERTLRYAVQRHRELQLLRAREAVLAENELVHHSTFNDAPVGIAHLALDGRFLRVNPRLCETLGYSPTELRERTFLELTHPDDLPADLAGRDQLLSGEISRYTAQKRYRRRDGTYTAMHMSASLHRSPSGEPRHFITVLKDISDLRRAQEELDHIFNLSPDMISTATYDGYFTRTNAAWSKTLEYTAEELRAVPLISFVHPDDREATMRSRERVLSGGTLFGFTNRYRTRSGAYRWIEWHTKADTVNKVIYAVARDRTESRQLEEQLRQSQKMEAVGRLAGGVAHDFNNLLTVIIGFCELVLADLPPGDANRDNLEQVRLAAQSAESLTRQLLAFSRNQVLDPEVFDLNELVLEAKRLLGRVLGEDIELVTELTDTPCCVNADRTHIEHAILNLAVNARDAMPSGGTLRIATGVTAFDQDAVGPHPGGRAGRHAVIRVSDTGVGMTPEVQARAFEPFFTTKEKGKGTGLGLSTVYGTVEQSGGYLSLDSAPGAGTTITIALPLVAEPPPPHRERAAEEAPDTAAAGTILLVEDQDEVRSIVRRVLAGAGYTVLEAAGGPVALDLLDDDAPPIDLLLTDVVMPQMSGRELATVVTRRSPRTRVLYMSGYTAGIVGEYGLLEEGMELLQKPFKPTHLLERVRRMLDRAER